MNQWVRVIDHGKKWNFGINYNLYRIKKRIIYRLRIPLDRIEKNISNIQGYKSAIDSNNLRIMRQEICFDTLYYAPCSIIYDEFGYCLWYYIETSKCDSYESYKF